MMNGKFFVAFVCVSMLSACGGEESRDTTLNKTQAGTFLSLAGTGLSAATGSASFLPRRIAEATAFADKQLLRSMLKPFTSTTLDDTQACAAGGTVQIEGTLSYSTATLDSDTERTTLDFNLNQTFLDCKVQGSDGETYKIDGYMNMSDATGTFDVTTVDDEASIEANFAFSIVGEMDFAGGDTEVDDCEITFTAESSFSASSYSHEWSGKICGKSMSDTTVL